MKRSLLLSLVIVAFAIDVFAGDIRSVPWNEANIEGLRGSDKAAVTTFINAALPPNWMEVPPYSVRESGWAKVGGGRFDLIVPLDISGRGYSNILMIYSRDSAGKVESQELHGWKMGNLPEMIRDLNGDGKDELIIPTELGPSGSWFPLVNMPGWPEVYRLNNGKFVEASRDFPSFYDTEVLPRLNQQIGEAEARISREPFQKATVAVMEMEKSKILRVLGRDPGAGLQQAYEWMYSDDTQVLQCAIATFADIGGHETELRIARQALPAAEIHQMESHKGG